MGRPGPRPRIEDLVEAYYLSLYRYGYRLCGTSSEAEDLTQETYCQAQAKLHQLREPDRARSWLFSILRNAYLHRLRDRKMEHQVSLDQIGEVPDRPSEPIPEVEPEQLQKALNELPEAFRTPLILFYFEDFSYRDIAEHMDVPLGTVMSRLARAESFLRSKLLQPAGVFSGEREEDA